MNNIRTESISRSKRRELAIGYLFLWPTITLLSIFMFYPLLKTSYLSLFSTNIRGQTVAFIGIDNYTRLLGSADFYSSLLTTVLFTVYTVPTGIFLALLLAVLSHGKKRGMRGFQFVFCLPLAVSVGTASVIWTLILNPTVGIFNYALTQIGLQPVGWLIDADTALYAVSIATVWMNSGFLFIILLAGLQGIPDDLYEAATIDGAGPVRSFMNITIPLLSPTIFFVTIVSVIDAFQTFGQINIMTQGGPMGSTKVFVYALYQEAFRNFQYGPACARAIVLFVIILILTGIQFKIGEKKVHYQ
ncbi:sugar ABC transporter permease [Paenibacillus sp. FSL H8-0034]|uniref:carbohydrate ABC transporter permease n=1 Tax=Paenibacillus sp. FSL H8-0034 TaxID=2954671 RepID=UPI0030F9F407